MQHLVIGPLLIVVGILLLDLFRFSFGGGMSDSLRKRVDTMGVWGALLLGIVFALAFCPVSAGLFFGGLVPLALQGNAVFLSSLKNRKFDFRAQVARVRPETSPLSARQVFIRVSRGTTRCVNL